jgi:hypothetical protein
MLRNTELRDQKSDSNFFIKRSFDIMLDEFLKRISTRGFPTSQLGQVPFLPSSTHPPSPVAGLSPNWPMKSLILHEATEWLYILQRRYWIPASQKKESSRAQTLLPSTKLSSFFLFLILSLPTCSFYSSSRSPESRLCTKPESFRERLSG